MPPNGGAARSEIWLTLLRRAEYSWDFEDGIGAELFGGVPEALFRDGGCGHFLRRCDPNHAGDSKKGRSYSAPH